MAIWDIFRRKGEEPEDEIEDDFDPAKVTEIDTEPETKPSPEELAKQRLQQRRQTIELYVERMYDNRCDCYMLVDHNTTPEQLEKDENLRLQVTPLNPHNPMPVIHVAVDELSAHHMARLYHCVADGVPLVKKVPFNVFSTMLNNLMRIGVFTVVIHEDDTTTVADSGHINAYASGSLLKQDIGPYTHYVQTMRSVFRTRSTKGNYYLIASEAPEGSGKFAPTFFGDQEKKSVHLPIFAAEALAKRSQELMKQGNDNRNTRIMTITPVQLVNLLNALMRGMQNKAFPIQLIEPTGHHPMTSAYFMQTLIMAYGMKTRAPEEGKEPKAADAETGETAETGTKESPIHLYTPEESSAPVEEAPEETETVSAKAAPEAAEEPATSEE